MYLDTQFYETIIFRNIFQRIFGLYFVALEPFYILFYLLKLRKTWKKIVSQN